MVQLVFVSWWGLGLNFRSFGGGLAGRGVGGMLIGGWTRDLAVGWRWDGPACKGTCSAVAWTGVQHG